MKKVDYDQNLHKNYQKGRKHSEETLRLWLEAIAKYLTHSLPIPIVGLSHRKRGGASPTLLTILDLGSGTGRFSPHLG